MPNLEPRIPDTFVEYAEPMNSEGVTAGCMIFCQNHPISILRAKLQAFWFALKWRAFRRRGRLLK